MGQSRDGKPGIDPLSGIGFARTILPYGLQRRLVQAAVQNPFLESVQTIARVDQAFVFNRCLKRSPRMPLRTSTRFIVSAPLRLPPPPSWWRQIDGKAIPMVQHGGSHPTHRLTQGQQANKKRMAMVAPVITGRNLGTYWRGSSKACSQPPPGSRR